MFQVEHAQMTPGDGLSFKPPAVSKTSIQLPSMLHLAQQKLHVRQSNFFINDFSLSSRGYHEMIV